MCILAPVCVALKLQLDQYIDTYQIHIEKYLCKVASHGKYDIVGRLCNPKISSCFLHHIDWCMVTKDSIQVLEHFYLSIYMKVLSLGLP